MIFMKKILFLAAIFSLPLVAAEPLLVAAESQASPATPASAPASPKAFAATWPIAQNGGSRPAKKPSSKAAGAAPISLSSLSSSHEPQAPLLSIRPHYQQSSPEKTTSFAQDQTGQAVSPTPVALPAAAAAPHYQQSRPAEIATAENQAGSPSSSQGSPSLSSPALRTPSSASASCPDLTRPAALSPSYLFNVLVMISNQRARLALLLGATHGQHRAAQHYRPRITDIETKIAREQEAHRKLSDKLNKETEKSAGLEKEKLTIQAKVDEARGDTTKAYHKIDQQKEQITALEKEKSDLQKEKTGLESRFNSAHDKTKRKLRNTRIAFGLTALTVGSVATYFVVKAYKK